MTTDKTPTEALAQLRHLYAQLKSQDGMSRTDRARIADGILSPAIAALEKWGQPAQAAEPFCWHWENTFNGGTGTVKKNPETLGINMAHPDYKWTALYTTPQPAQTQAWAVTDAQVLAAARVVSPNLFRHGLQPLPHDGANTAARMRKEADTVRKMLEAANGTKGGQHGEATPQPTQPVERVQLTPERVKEIVRGAGYDQCGIPDTERAAFINGLRHGEREHGIKGGQP